MGRQARRGPRLRFSNSTASNAPIGVTGASWAVSSAARSLAVMGPSPKCLALTQVFDELVSETRGLRRRRSAHDHIVAPLATFGAR